ncbi:aarF domain-containing protein kinase 1 isoform X4 [Acipenser ruthenus]|uniref:aarF domain-containing protein kinase 1 isoform X4 n=1 Tax=Acipenser ruthenus TaxID=7906 RepID=UPI00274191AD|nr:aarF domain-containing protein kinase 1 isoform X4 [Acipenser ruthenus]
MQCSYRYLTGKCFSLLRTYIIARTCVMAVRLLKVSSLATTVFAASGFYLYNSYVDPNDISIVRFGRAAITTAVISYDYLTSLKTVPYGTEDYWAVKSKIAQLFVSFEESPQGAASLAQVHKAVLHDGRTVAVKVQHPKVQTQSSKDILVIEFLLKTVTWLFPDFGFMWLVEEAKKNMPLELDFLNEGRNAERVANMLKHFEFLKVPKIHWDLSTKRILTMEFVEGGQVNDLEYMKENCIDVNEISRNLGKMYSEMIFVNGFVHCDPHPGNVLVKKCPKTNKTEIILLDHGLYQVLNDRFRLDYCRLWQSLIKTDMKRVEKYSRRLGAGDLYPLFACVLTARSWTAVNSGISQTTVTNKEDVEIRTNAALYLPQISELLNKVPREMLLLLKTNDLLRGIETTLQTRASASSFFNMSRCCIRAIAKYQKKRSRSRYKKMQIYFSEAFTLWQINLYELLLWIRGSTLGNWIVSFLNHIHYVH